jgi:hypothetical protein
MFDDGLPYAIDNPTRKDPPPMSVINPPTATSTTSSLPSGVVTLSAIVAAVLTSTGVAQVTPGVQEVVIGAATVLTALHVHVALPRGAGSKLVAALQSVLKVLGG